jgi:hypothetical protein
MNSEAHNALRLRRLGTDTWQEPVVYMHRDCPVCRSGGLELHASIDERVEKEQPLFTVHAETPGELAYALEYAERQEDNIIGIGRIREGA